MIVFRPLESSLLRMENHVAVRHASTRLPIRVDASWDGPAPLGRTIRVRDGDVIVSADDRFPAPGAPPVIVVAVRDPLLAMRLAQPAQQVTLSQPDITLDFDPVPMVVTVQLVRATGAASTGKTVQARGGGTTVPLPEVTATPGSYRSAARTWTAAFHPFELLVGGTLVRRVAIDFTRAETRVRVVDPT